MNHDCNHHMEFVRVDQGGAEVHCCTICGGIEIYG